MGRSSDLLRRIRSGDGAAEELFARTFLPRVRGLMLVETHDSDLAEDLTQDSLLAALKGLRAGHLQEPELLGAFVRGTALHVLHSHFRSMRRHATEVPLLEEPGVPPAESPLVSMERRKLVDQLLPRFGTLDRAILRGSLVEGLGPGEIAARMHLRPDLVRARKLRALRRLAEYARLYRPARLQSGPM